MSTLANWSWMVMIAFAAGASIVTGSLWWWPISLGLWILFVLAYATVRATVATLRERKEAR